MRSRKLIYWEVGKYQNDMVWILYFIDIMLNPLSLMFQGFKAKLSFL